MTTPATPMKVSARRGSQSAPDPFNVHADLNLNPNRACSSTITIVRVSPEQQQHHHQRSPNSGHGHGRAGYQHQQQPPTRLSFAFSSFAGPSSPPPGGSPTSSPRLRPSAFLGTLGAGKPRLTPDQIVDLARQATSPSSTTTSNANAGPTAAAAPTATFTPLPDDVYLPFLDRPAEVNALISSPPDVKLFTLLAQTFPRSTPISTSSQTLPPNPINWTYPNLIYHLTKVDRSIAPDFLWTVAARKCIFAHSELIWERVKGALGVPPELDVDVEFVEGGEGDVEGEREGEERNEDRKDDADDWEQAILDSPICIKSPLRDRFDDGYERHALVEEGPLFDGEGDADGEERMISIEPLLSPPPPTSTSTLASVGGGTLGLGLGDIAEGAEDEDEDEDVQAEAEDQTNEEAAQALIASKIQGLRISTSPLPLSLAGTPAATPPHTTSSSPPPPPHPGDSPRLRAHSRASSHSSLTGTGPFYQPESTGSLAALWSVVRQEGVFTSSSSVGGSEAGFGGASEDGAGESGMGPRFPANFARLGRGRTPVVGGGGAPAQVRKRVRYVTSSHEEAKKGRAFSHGAGSLLSSSVHHERRRSG